MSFDESMNGQKVNEILKGSRDELILKWPLNKMPEVPNLFWQESRHNIPPSIIIFIDREAREIM